MTDTATILIVFGLWALAVGGWIANLVKFAGALAEPLTGLEVLRGIGIVAMPIGCVLGFF